ncbi:MAG: hypothetical protein JXR83_09895 [Deltaproteobacteria bacterium]|nr:hypothetical protein [Deltaproteobacteria bacterium]
MDARCGATLWLAAMAAACGDGTFSAQLVYPSQQLFERGRTVELFVGEGFACSGLRAAPGTPRLVFDSHADSPEVGQVAIGKVAFLAEVSDGDCLVFLEGCAETEIRRGVDNTVKIALREVAGAGCGAGQRCEQGRCVAGDAASADVSHADSSANDRRDAGVADVGGDAAAADISWPDVRVDAGYPDATAADAADAAQVDARHDTGLPDALPDSGWPDAQALDAAGFQFSVLVDGIPTRFARRWQIDISPTLTGQPLDRFPVLFDSAVDSALMDELRPLAAGGHVRQAQGFDVVFAAADGTEILKHEVESYLSATGEYRAWVRVDLVGASQSIFLYFGSDQVVADVQHASAVWANGFVGVWHLGESTGAVLDSTALGRNGIANGAQPGVLAPIGTGYEFSATEEDSIAIDQLAGAWSIGQMTVSVWVRIADDPVVDDNTILSQYTCDYDDGFELRVTDDTGHVNYDVFRMCHAETCEDVFGRRISSDTWHHVAGVRTASELLIYSDGALIFQVDDDYSGLTLVPASGLYLGRNACNARNHLSGRLDEVRLSSTARPAAWIHASYLNQSAPGSTYTVIH